MAVILGDIFSVSFGRSVIQAWQLCSSNEEMVGILFSGKGITLFDPSLSLDLAYTLFGIFNILWLGYEMLCVVMTIYSFFM